MSTVSDGTNKRARESFKWLEVFATLFGLAGLLGGGGMIIYGLTDSDRNSLIVPGIAVLVAGLWGAVFARALSVMVELLLELLTNLPGS